MADGTKPWHPECEVVLTPEEYADFQAELARPPQAIPALMRLFRMRRENLRKLGDSDPQ
jgi:hypothetical protein